MNRGGTLSIDCLALSFSLSHPRGKSSCQPSAQEGPSGAPGDHRQGHQGLLDPVCQWVATLREPWNSGSLLPLSRPFSGSLSSLCDRWARTVWRCAPVYTAIVHYCKSCLSHAGSDLLSAQRARFMFTDAGHMFGWIWECVRMFVTRVHAIQNVSLLFNSWVGIWIGHTP